MSGREPGCNNACMKTLSDDTLREAREKLLDRGVLLRDRLHSVQADLRGATAPAAQVPAAGVVREREEVLQAIAKSDSAELGRIESALEHTEDDTFGLCEECGREIEAARLAAVPSASRCQACAPDA